MNNILYKDLSYQIIGLAMEVHRKLGYGFLEKVYENSLMILLKRVNWLKILGLKTLREYWMKMKLPTTAKLLRLCRIPTQVS